MSEIRQPGGRGTRKNLVSRSGAAVGRSTDAGAHAGSPAAPQSRVIRAVRREAGRGIPSRHIIAVVILLAATTLQLRRLTGDFIWPRANQYWGLRGYAAWERSALLSEGKDFLEFVSFLRGAVPESGKVVLPPHSDVSEAGPFSFPTFIQYFLFPRQILNCSEPVDECVRLLTGANSYLVRVGSFPSPSVASQHKLYVPFRDDMGLYVPK